MKDGRILYQGRPADILPFYASRGHVCPDDYNPSDFVMNLCQSETTEILDSKGLFVEIPDEFRVQASSKKLTSSVMEFTSQSSFLKQILAISYREVVNAYRDTPALIGRFGVTVVLSLIFGLIFLRACGKDNGDQDNYNAHVGAISMVVIFGLFGSGQSILLSFPFERPMILREYATGTCKSASIILQVYLISCELTKCFSSGCLFIR